MTKKTLLIAFLAVSVWASNYSSGSRGISRGSRLPSPQRERGAGDEGDRQNWALKGSKFSILQSQVGSQHKNGFLPGARVLLDAHNCYPEQGRWADRLDRALKTGLPIAIEQDLAWYVEKGSGQSWSVLAHNVPSGAEPTLKNHFFERIRPIVEQALHDGSKKDWPLVTLNLDFKSEEPAHLQFIRKLLGEYESWLCTAPRTATPEVASRLELRPVLVLTGSSDTQQTVFHDDVPIGGRLRLFGAVQLPKNTPTSLQRVPAATNYRRWWNNSWSIVEQGGQREAGDWTPADNERLESLVRTAHVRGLWIRFYTLNGHAEPDSLGWTPGYNFGSIEQVRLRWQAALEAGVDLIATDQYEAFAALRLRNAVR